MTQKKGQAAAHQGRTQTSISRAVAVQLPRVHAAARKKLTASPAFRKLKPEQRQQLSLAFASMCKVSSRILAEQARQKAGTQPAASQLPDTAFATLLDAVDFPSFVSGLIEGTFNAIVGASIEQMQAYSDLLNAVATALSGFDNHGRILKKPAG